LGIDSLLIRIIVGIFLLIVFKFFLECPVSSVGVLEVAFVKTGKKGELDVEFHTHIHF
jgi:hypothetical protein